MKKFIKCFLFYFSSLFFLECVFKITCFGVLFDTGLVYMSLFTILYAIFMSTVTLFIPRKISFSVTLLIYIFTAVLFIAEFVFMYIYNMAFSMYSLSMADQAFDFVDIIFRILKEQWLVVILFLLPTILFVVLHKSVIDHIGVKEIWKPSISFAILYFLVLFSLGFDREGVYSVKNLYHNTHAPTVMINKLGLATVFRLDLSRFLFGFEPSIVIEDVKEEETSEEEKIVYNKLDLNFDFETDDENIKSLNSYFKSQNPTNQNDYTGIFKGKNLIYILGESFSTMAVDEELTPTLYKLVNDGLYFENYYAPMFMSTTGGEFQFSTGLIPNQQSLKEWRKGKVTFPYAIGNVFNDLDYTVKAYHNWKHTYYQRNKTMSTLGYNSFKACGNGLENKMNCNIWPTSDIDMMKATVDEFINEENFAVHYITLSGHAEYNFFGNNMAMKNKKLVKDLEYSDAIKAYMATQIELDRALEYLIKRLEGKGILDNTVIVLSGDHYPYTLTVEEINEKSSYERDETFGVSHTSLAIYNTGLEKKTIEKLSCSIDLLPTLLNMFGKEYDSRLLLGNDIMSENESLVVFSDNSWMSEKGRYDAKLGKFIPNDGVKVEEDYITRINLEVQNRVNVSTKIVSSNYYMKFFEQQLQE